MPFFDHFFVLSALVVASIINAHPISAKGNSYSNDSSIRSTILSLSKSPAISSTITSSPVLTATTTILTTTPSATATPQILITGNRSTMHLSASASSIYDEAEYVCMTFEIIPVGDLKNVYIVGQGLGQVSFQTINANDVINCVEERKNGKIGSLEFSALSDPKRIFVKVDRLSLPEPGSKLSGIIKIYAEGIPPTEILLQIEQPSYKWYWTLPWWLFQILVTAIVGFGAYWARKRYDTYAADKKADQDAHDDFLKKFHSDLDKFFQIEYVEIVRRYRSDEKQFASVLKEREDFKLFLEQLPRKLAKELEKAIESEKYEKIKSTLTDIFKDNMNDIESAENRSEEK